MSNIRFNCETNEIIDFFSEKIVLKQPTTSKTAIICTQKKGQPDVKVTYFSMANTPLSDEIYYQELLRVQDSEHFIEYFDQYILCGANGAVAVYKFIDETQTFILDDVYEISQTGSINSITADFRSVPFYELTGRKSLPQQKMLIKKTEDN